MTKYISLTFLMALLPVTAVSDAAAAQRPSDLEIAKLVLPRVASHRAYAPGRQLWVNVGKLPGEGLPVQSLDFAEDLAPGELPLDAQVTASNCLGRESLASCGLGIEDALVVLSHGVPHPRGWRVTVLLRYTLNEEGHLGGLTYKVVLAKRAGGWEIVEFKGVGVP